MVDGKLKDEHLMVCVAFILIQYQFCWWVYIYKVVLSVSLPLKVIGSIKTETLGNFLFCMFAKEVIFSTFVHSYSSFSFKVLSILLTIICFAGQLCIEVVSS